MAQLNFDARSVVPDSGQQDPIPAGWYNVVMDKSEMKPTKDGTGMRLEMQFKVIDGQYVSRKVFEGLNLQNSNPVAQEIAYKQLSAIAHAVNVLIVEDSSQLHNIPLKIKVNLKGAGGGYDAKNEIKAYKNINEVVAAPAAAPTAPAAFGAPPPAFAPAAPAPAFAPPAAAPQPWAPPAAAQPWAPPAAPAAPVQAAAPAWAPAPVAAPQAPAWATAPAAQAPAPVAVAPVAAAPTPNPAAGIVPPWSTAPATPAA
jgi:hypothetical protein